MRTGTAMPNTAKIPRFLGVKRNPFSSTSLAAPFASTNLFGITSVGVRGPAATAKGGKNAMGRGWLVRGRSIGGSRVRAHAEGAFARGNDWYAVEAPAHALLARLCERAGLRRARPCGVTSVERERCVEKKSRRKMSICTCKQSPARSEGSSSCVLSRDRAFAHQSVSTPRR